MMFDFELLIPLTAIFFVIGVPVLAFATHFVLRPLVKDVIGALRSRGEVEEADLLSRLDRLEQSVLDQGQQIDRLIEAEAFRRRLEGGGSSQEPPALEG
jgi:hypothetical protein